MFWLSALARDTDLRRDRTRRADGRRVPDLRKRSRRPGGETMRAVQMGARRAAGEVRQPADLSSVGRHHGETAQSRRIARACPVTSTPNAGTRSFTTRVSWRSTTRRSTVICSRRSRCKSWTAPSRTWILFWRSCIRKRRRHPRPR